MDKLKTNILYKVIFLSLPLLVATVTHGTIKPNGTYMIKSIPFASGIREPSDQYKVDRYTKAYLSEVDEDKRLKLNQSHFKVWGGSVSKWAKRLAKLNVEQLDQLYARLTSGPIPNGYYKGEVAISKGGPVHGVVAALAGNLLAQVGRKLTESIAEGVWKGKHFYKDKRVLRNYIRQKGLLINTLDKKKLISKDEVTRESKEAGDIAKLGIHKFNLRFPAKLYCGQSLMDSRRESIIIDYAYGRDAAFECDDEKCTEKKGSYIPKFDGLADKSGLTFRDEIRMVKPGLYLGRGYINRIFGLYFILYNETVAAEYKNSTAGKKVHSHDECRVGSQRLRQAKSNGGKTNIWQ